MDIIIKDIPDDCEPADIARLLLTIGDATSCVVGHTVRVGTIEEQNEKPLHVQAAEILGHIHNRDYGLAESKARLLRDRLQKGDWTLGTGTETDRADDGFVRMRCDGTIDNVHISNIALSAEHMRCANNHTNKDTLIKDLKAKIRSIRNAWLIACDDVNAMKSDRDVWEQEAHRLIERLDECAHSIEDLESKVGMIPDNFWSVVGQKDATIKQLGNTIDVKDKMLEKYRHEIVGLRDMHDVVWDKVHALEAELSVRKEDSEMLMQVVEIVRQWDAVGAGIYPNLYQINSLHECLADYTDAPEAREE